MARERKMEGFPLPPEDNNRGNEFQNVDMSLGFSFSNSNSSDWYLEKLTKDKEKIQKIKDILKKYGLEIPDKLVHFRKGCVPVELEDKFIVFTPDMKFFTVLTHLESSIKVVNVPSSIKRKIFEIFSEIKKVLNK